MKLSFNTWVYSSFPVWVPAYPIDETIKRIAKAGYDGIEIGAATPHAYPDYTGPERRREIRSMLEHNGIALSSMLPAPGGGAGFNVSSPLPEERAAALDQYNKVIDLCADLGGNLVIYVAGWQVYGTDRRQAWAWSRDALGQVAGHARDRGVTLVIEPTSTDSNLVDDCDDAIQMMEEVGAPNVKLMFDTFHALYRNEVPTDYVYRMGPNLAHLHIADVGRSAPGDGRIDYPALIAALREVGYDGYLTMEIGYDRRAVEPDLMARKAIEFLRPLMS
ncbi:MAG: sugar phosphate isomerase/epimerase [Rubellimicrobium sp.]|nr:sugar phosphate isomerase/epimerase [Rubellimicrobium sp.]